LKGDHTKVELECNKKNTILLADTKKENYFSVERQVHLLKIYLFFQIIAIYNNSQTEYGITGILVTSW